MGEEEIRWQFLLKNQEILSKYKYMGSVNRYLLGFGNYGRSCKSELTELRGWRNERLKELEEIGGWMDSVIGDYSVEVVDAGKGTDWFVVSCLILVIACGGLFTASRIWGF